MRADLCLCAFGLNASEYAAFACHAIVVYTA